MVALGCLNAHIKGTEFNTSNMGTYIAMEPVNTSVNLMISTLEHYRDKQDEYAFKSYLIDRAHDSD